MRTLFLTSTHEWWSNFSADRIVWHFFISIRIYISESEELRQNASSRQKNIKDHVIRMSLWVDHDVCTPTSYISFSIFLFKQFQHSKEDGWTTGQPFEQSLKLYSIQVVMRSRICYALDDTTHYGRYEVFRQHRWLYTPNCHCNFHYLSTDSNGTVAKLQHS